MHGITTCRKNSNVVSAAASNYLIFFACVDIAVYEPFQQQSSRHLAQHSTAQHSTAQHSTAQHSTAQHSTAQQHSSLISHLLWGDTGHSKVSHFAVANAWPHAFAALAQQRRQTICVWKHLDHPGRSSHYPSQTPAGCIDQSQMCPGSVGQLGSGLALAAPLQEHA